MAAYVIAELAIEDQEGFGRYREMVPATIAAYGGRYLARGGRTAVLEGEGSPERIVLLEFPSFEQAQAWWASEEYAEAKALRQATARTRLMVVEGVPGS